MNLLPGLRELRAPLASGYLWLISAWLFLGHWGWLPTRRPGGNGELARLWDLGGTLGKTVVLAAVTFIAYLIGSFLEVNPDGPLALLLAPLMLPDRRPGYLLRHGSDKRERARATLEDALTPEGLLKVSEGEARGFVGDFASLRVVRSISDEARVDLLDLLSRRNLLLRYSDFEDWSLGRIRVNVAGDLILYEVVGEMQQLASRLLVKNKALYEEYDRHMAAASVRMNIAMPLTALLLLATWLSNIAIWVRVALTLVTLLVGYVILRQGFQRAISAHDVLAQALVLNEIQSRHIRPARETSARPSEGRAGSVARDGGIKEPAEAD